MYCRSIVGRYLDFACALQFVANQSCGSTFSAQALALSFFCVFSNLESWLPYKRILSQITVACNKAAF